MRRAVLGVLLAVLALGPVGGVEAAETGAGQPAATVTSASLRAERNLLVTRIAALTDEATRAEARVADAERRRVMSAAAAAKARKRFALHAVEAYIDGVQDSEDEQLRRRAWGDSLAETDRRVLGELRAALASAERDGAASTLAIAEARKLRADLDALRVTLERTIAERVAAERKAAAARAKATGGAIGVPRHRRATMSQYELMQRYRFGPGSGVPEGLVATGEAFEGKASWYGPGFDGRPTASGAIYDQEGWTVAHRTLPLGTILLLSREGRQVVVLVNDRGPFVNGRVLDLSHGVANALGTVQAGVAWVRAEILVPA